MISSLLIIGAILLMAYVVHRATAKARGGQTPSLGLLAYKEDAGNSSVKGRKGAGDSRA